MTTLRATRPSRLLLRALLALPLLLLTFAAGACFDPLPPDDDDDPPPGECQAVRGPWDLTLTGDANGEFSFDIASCIDVGGDFWRARYVSDSGWLIELTAGPLQQGVELLEGVSATLEDPNGVLWEVNGDVGDPASLNVQHYQAPEPPCGEWTVSGFTAAPGDLIVIAPQPLPLRCPLVQ